jgi:hypothetical protein
MSERTKRLLGILGFVAVVLGIAYALYRVFFSPSVAPTPLPAPSASTEPGSTASLPSSQPAGDRGTVEEETPGTLPTASAIAQGGPTKVNPLTLTPVFSPQMAPDGQLRYFNPNDGKFYATDSQGNVHSVFNQAFKDASAITWNGTASAAIVEFPDGANVSVNLETGKAIPLPQHWEDFSFSPNGKQIAAKSIGIDPDNRWLTIANADGSRAEAVAALGNNASKVHVNWAPHDQVVAFAETGTPQSFGRQQILAIGKHEENLPGLMVEGFNFTPQWSKTGSSLLYSASSQADGYMPRLWVVDGESNTLGGHRRSLPLQTWADKCTFTDDSTAYCAVPTNMPEGAGLQRALLRNTPDQIYRVNIQTGATSLIGQPENQVPITNLRVSPDGQTLFYQNARSLTLESLRLR